MPAEFWPAQRPNRKKTYPISHMPKHDREKDADNETAEELKSRAEASNPGTPWRN